MDTELTHVMTNRAIPLRSQPTKIDEVFKKFVAKRSLQFLCTLTAHKPDFPRFLFLKNNVIPSVHICLSYYDEN